MSYRLAPLRLRPARAFALPLALLASAFAISPASAETREDGQVWFQTVAQGPVAGDIVYFAELQPRFHMEGPQLAQLLVRPAVGLKLGKSVTLYQGYAHVRTPRDGARDASENRSFQQLSWSLGAPGGVRLSSRTRFEQRWLSTGDDVGLRVRQMIRAAVPVADEGKVALLGWGEVFVALNDTDWGASGGFDRLRSFGGLELPLSGTSTVELGYLNQFVRQPGRPDQMDHVAAVNLMLRR